jgi:hypothetical protein
MDKTAMSGPVFLTDPLPDEPIPVPGCDVCRGLAAWWRRAMDPKSESYDPSRASDWAIEIRRHPHPKKQATA